jgi:prephenate dehydratase/chorismate mutase/prephenate dehydratase
MLLKERPEGTAAIAGTFAAEFYNLEVVEKGIEDHHNNFTRFLVLSQEPGPKDGNKCSILFGTEHKAGSLFRVLQEFAEAGINLTRIESMPSRNDPGNYLFFMDFQGSIEDPAVIGVLEEVRRATPIYKFLGCYRAAQNDEATY